MNRINNVIDYLESLGETIPTGIWGMMKETQPILRTLVYVDRKGNEYLPEGSLEVIREMYEKQYAKLTIKEETAEDIEKRLTNILKKYKGKKENIFILEGEERDYLEDILSRSALIKGDIRKYGAVINITVVKKEGFNWPCFEVEYEKKKQVISIKNYLNPLSKKVVDIWTGEESVCY